MYHVHCIVICVYTYTCSGVEELMKWYPDLINKARKDGFTALHIAAVNGHTDIVSLLASHVKLIAVYSHYKIPLRRC